MLRCIGDGQAGTRRQNVHASLALRQLLQELEPMRMRQRFGDGGELREQRQLWTAA